MFALGTPIWLVISKHVLLRASFKDFVGWLPGPLFFLSISIFGYWLNWTWKGKEKEEIDVGGDSVGNEWSLDIRNKYAMEIGEKRVVKCRNDCGLELLRGSNSSVRSTKAVPLTSRSTRSARNSTTRTR